ncbi:hypothetical protein [Campylobacter coli]|uniref:hypothetical protein n=1 Tax=Campylobacter coli TaxID=195 RepID=UPI001E310C7C|nr:hypothetical protein [Campylobacter coli]
MGNEFQFFSLSPTKITCETWFMEGTLKPNYHFALIDNDNLATVIEHFISHPKDALEIINNAHQYVKNS